VRALRRPGVAVVTHAYSSWGTSVEELGAVLAERVDAWARRSGSHQRSGSQPTGLRTVRIVVNSSSIVRFAANPATIES